MSVILFGIAGLLIARYLGPDNYGVFNAGIALPASLSLSFLIGIDGVLPREVARKPEDFGGLLLSALYPIFIWMIILSLLILIIGYLLGYSTEIYQVLIVALFIYIFRSFTILVRSVMRGLRRMASDVLIQVSESFVAIFWFYSFKYFRSAFSAALAFLGQLFSH